MEFALCFIAGMCVGGVCGVAYVRRRSDVQAISKMDSAYRRAVDAVRSGDWLAALAFVSESLGNKPSHEAYNLLGTVWTRCQRYSSAAEAFRMARHMAGYGPSAPRGVLIPDAVAQYFHAEATAHARNGDWEFAYLRVREALHLMSQRRLPRFIEFGDCESWTRMIRMVGAINHLERGEARAVSMEDADWILRESKVGGFANVAETVMETSEKPSDQWKQAVNTAWEELDKARRETPIQIVDAEI